MIEGLFIEACRAKLNAEIIESRHPDTKGLLEPIHALYERANDLFTYMLREQDEAAEAVKQHDELMEAEATRVPT